MSSKKQTIIILLVASIVLLAKLVFSYNVYGTNDITSWIYYARAINSVGTVNIYSLLGVYNHPPLISWLLKLLTLIEAKTHLAFPYLLRLLPIFADFASVFVIWELVKKYDLKHKLAITIICAVNPVNFLVSGFHGNDDSVFIFFVLLAVYFLENKRTVAAGLIYGLSMCVKPVPAILLPILVFYIDGPGRKLKFTLSSFVIPAIVFIPYLIKNFIAVVTNIFLYGSDKGVWGLWLIFSPLCNSGNIFIKHAAWSVFKFYTIYHMPLFLLLIFILPQMLIRNKNLNLAERVFLVFCIFLIFTPGFGVQYLSWLSLFSIMALPVMGGIYSLISGFFLYRVYAYWGGAQPPYYANLWKVGFWVGFEKMLSLLVWVTIIVMLIRFLYRHKKFSCG